jgi:hypothetical protein
MGHFSRMNSSIDGVRCCGGVVPFKDFMFFERIRPNSVVQFAHVKDDGDMDTYIIRLWNKRNDNGANERVHHAEEEAGSRAEKRTNRA